VLEGGRKVKFLLDTGASGNVLSRSMFDQLPCRTRDRLNKEEIRATIADGSGLHIYGNITLHCHIRDLPVTIRFQVADISEDAILGMSFFVQNQCQLQLDQGVLRIQDEYLVCVNQSGSSPSSLPQTCRTIQKPAEITPCTTSRCQQLEEKSMKTTKNKETLVSITPGNKQKMKVDHTSVPPSPVGLRSKATHNVYSAVSNEQMFNHLADPGHKPNSHDLTTAPPSPSLTLSDYPTQGKVHPATPSTSSLMKMDIPTVSTTQLIKEDPRSAVSDSNKTSHHLVVHDPSDTTRDETRESHPTELKADYKRSCDEIDGSQLMEECGRILHEKVDDLKPASEDTVEQEDDPKTTKYEHTLHCIARIPQPAELTVTQMNDQCSSKELHKPCTSPKLPRDLSKLDIPVCVQQESGPAGLLSEVPHASKASSPPWPRIMNKPPSTITQPQPKPRRQYQMNRVKMKPTGTSPMKTVILTKCKDTAYGQQIMEEKTKYLQALHKSNKEYITCSRITVDD
jgi:hypothetical protein